MKRVNVQFAFLEPKSDECAADLHVQTFSESIIILMSEPDLASLLNDYLESCVDVMATYDDRIPTQNTIITIQDVQYSFPDSVIGEIVDDISDMAERCSEQRGLSRTLN